MFQFSLLFQLEVIYNTGIMMFTKLQKQKLSVLIRCPANTFFVCVGIINNLASEKKGQTEDLILTNHYLIWNKILKLLTFFVLGTAWMNYCLAGGVGVGLLILFMFKESYSRINMDIIVEPPESAENPVDIKATEEE